MAAEEAGSVASWVDVDDGAVDGFITDSGRFVSREEAGRLYYGEDVDLDADALPRAEREAVQAGEVVGGPALRDTDLSESVRRKVRAGEVPDVQRAPAGDGAEHVVAAAIRTRDGRIFKGALHVLAREAAREVGAIGLGGEGVAADGFLTSTGRFVSREEAGRIHFGPRPPRVVREEGLDSLDLPTRQRVAVQEGEVYGAPARRGETVRRGTGERDLFGAEQTADVPAQTSLLGDDDGTPAARSLAESERAARAELDQLRQVLALETDPTRRATAAARASALERLVNRGQAISAEELRTRAAAAASATLGTPPGLDQGVLFSPLTDLTSRVGMRARKALGVAAPAFNDVQSLRSISVKLAEAVGVPIREGRGNLKQMQALGAFWIKPESIRVRRLKMVGTVAHEVGHYLSKKYGIKTLAKGLDKQQRTAVRNELLGMGHRLYGSRKPNGGYMEEGVAEAFKFYVADPKRLQAEAPVFTAYLDTMLANEPALQAALDQARDDFARYDASTPHAKIRSVIGQGMPTRLRLSPRALVSALFDDLDPIKRAVAELGGSTSPAQDAYVLARLTKGNAGRARDLLDHGITEFHSRTRLTRGLGAILADVGEAHLEPFTEYVVSERVLELADRGVDAGFDVEAAKAVVAADRPRFEATARELWAYQDALLRHLRDAGLMTDATFKAMRDRNQRRVPFYRIFDPDDPASTSTGRARKLARNSAGVYGIKGSDRPIYHPLESIVRDVYEITDRAHKHHAAVALLKMALNTEGGAKIAERLPEAPKEAAKIPMARVIDKLVDMGFELPDDPAQLAALADEMLVTFYEKRQAGPGESVDMVMPVLLDGERVWVQINDRALWDAFNAMTVNELGMVGRLLTAPTRTLRMGATQVNPDFALVNPARDAVASAVFSRGPTRFPLYHLGRGMYHLLRDWAGLPDDTVNRWLQEGGEQAGMIGADLRTVQGAYETTIRELVQARDPIARRILRFPWQALRHPLQTTRALFGVLENATRVGEFAVTREARLGRGEAPGAAAVGAALDARDVTLDFFRAGSQSRHINHAVAFFNAYLQDVAKLAAEFDPRNLETPEGRRRMATVTARAVAFVTVPSLTLYLAQKDDPVYQELPEYLKASAWIILDDEDGPIPLTLDSGRKVRIWAIPRPHLLGYAFGYLPEKVLAGIAGEDQHALDHLARQSWTALTPPWIPTIAAPLVENFSNKSLHSGRPVYPQGTEKLAPEEQATRYTGETARLAGDALNYSPAKLENLLRGYTGGAGMAALDAADAGVRALRDELGLPPMRAEEPGRADTWRNVPVVRRLLADLPGASAASVQQVMDDFEEAEAHRLTFHKRQREGRDAAGYFAAHRDAILSVATAEETGSTAGPLRAYHKHLSGLLQLRSDALGAPGLSATERQQRARRIEDEMVRIARLYSGIGGRPASARPDTTTSGPTAGLRDLLNQFARQRAGAPR